MTHGSKARVEDADELEAQGRLLEALDALKAVDAERRDPTTESRLMALRHCAFEQLDRSAGREPWPPVEPDLFPGTRGIPEVWAGDVTAGLIAGAIVHHGCVLVRGLLTEEDVASLRRDIDRSFAARAAVANGTPIDETRPWFEPFLPGVGKTDSYSPGNHVRSVDAPRAFNNVLSTLDARGVTRLVTEYFGERPALSVNKCELRRVEPAVGPPDYHQDGAFLGRGIRTVNAWLSLSHCGVDAPGLDVVPRRVDHILEVGVDGAIFNWTVSPVTVQRELGDPETARPVFRPGDALLFDHFLVHRTANDPGLTHTRYAVETWFFAPSAYPLPKEGEKRDRPHLPLVY